MKKIFNLMLLLSLVVGVASCHSKTDTSLQANQKLDHIEDLIAHNSFNAAKIEIDSIHISYPKLIGVRRKAAALADTITRRESMRTLIFCDSVLESKTKEFELLLKDFRLEKDQRYQQFGNYIHKSQITESNISRNYLKAYLDENNDFYLVSNYSGSKIDHTAIKVSVGELYATSDTLTTSNPEFHSYVDDGIRYETLTFKNEAARSIALFINQYSISNLRVELIGNKSSRNYMLAISDKKAIATSCALWIVKSDINQLKNEIKKTKLKILQINKRNGK
jgi:hypothetical protein